MEVEDSYVIQSSFMWNKTEIMVGTYFASTWNSIFKKL